MSTAIAKNELLFHPVHGLCRVSDIQESSETKENAYTLIPASRARGRIQFVVNHGALQTSGFNKLIAPSEGKAILRYFKTGKKAKSVSGQAWELAELIREESFSKGSGRDPRRRQRVEHSVKGLSGELAFVLSKDIKEAAEMMQDNLAQAGSINQAVVSVFNKIEKGQV